MNFQSYLDNFKRILDSTKPEAPYDNPDYFEYTKLNWSRMNRWLKNGVLDEELQQNIKKINTPQTWIVITEPWCGDAAQIVPFFQLIAALNPLITTEYELRDAAPFRIEQYLTNGSKSIPVLVVKDAEGKDIFSWGPRPEEAQKLYLSLHKRNADFEETKIALQQWYNRDKGRTIQEELKALLQK